MRLGAHVYVGDNDPILARPAPAAALLVKHEVAVVDELVARPPQGSQVRPERQGEPLEPGVRNPVSVGMQ
jgi:hypothetical protein